MYKMRGAVAVEGVEAIKAIKAIKGGAVKVVKGGAIKGAVKGGAIKGQGIPSNKAAAQLGWINYMHMHLLRV
jgi:hypothetical protein